MKFNIITTISAIAAGATAMYYFDPAQGKRRRALVRDKVMSASRRTTDATRARGRQFASRVKGWTARVASRFVSTREPATPRQLQNRVRSRIGHLVSHPRAVTVEVIGDGRVRLTGHVLEQEFDTLLNEVENVAGVRHVDNQLMVHESVGNVAELQGEPGRPGVHGEGRIRLWRALAVVAPVALLAATVRPASRRRKLVSRLSRRLSVQPRGWPMLSGRKRRSYFNVLRAS